MPYNLVSSYFYGARFFDSRESLIRGNNEEDMRSDLKPILPARSLARHGSFIRTRLRFLVQRARIVGIRIFFPRPPRHSIGQPCPNWPRLDAIRLRPVERA